MTKGTKTNVRTRSDSAHRTNLPLLRLVVNEDRSRAMDLKRLPMTRLRPIESDMNSVCFSKAVFFAFTAIVNQRKYMLWWRLHRSTWVY